MKRILAVVVSAALIGLMGCSPVNSPSTPQTPKYTISITVSNGSVALNPTGGTYDSGTVVTLTPSASAGYTFSGWSGDLSGTANPGSIIMTSNKSVTATFNPASAGIHGTISSDTIWGNAQNDYHIDGDLTINANVTWGKKIQVRVDDGATISIEGNGKLTILEGVSAKMGTGSDFEVGYNGSGTLVTQGSDSLPILFTKSTGVSYWGSDNNGGFVLFDGTTSLTSFNHCIIEYATSGIDVGKNPVSVTYCTIRNNQKYGINFESPAAPKDSASFVHDSITGNGNYPIAIDAEGLTKLSGDTYISGNNTSNMGKQDGILVSGGPVTKSGTWKKHGVPYIITSYIDVGVATGVTITINPGVTCKFDQTAYIQVGYNGSATLLANGTVADSIRFGKTDIGTFWGYNSGSKGGFVFYDGTTTNTSVTYCVIDSATAGLDVGDKVKVTISNNAVRNNELSGIIFESSGSPKDSASFVNNAITGNGSYAIEISASQLGNLSGTGTVAGNTAGGIFVNGDGVAANAIWKKHDAPYIVDGQIDIGATAGATVTVRQGSKFELVKDAYIQVGYNGSGTFIANGIAADPISFTSHISGSYWGYDAGSHGGFMFYDGTTSTSSLAYCTIASATSGIYDDAAVTIDHCTVRDNKYYGIEYGPNGDTTKVNTATCTFANNGSGDFLPAN